MDVCHAKRMVCWPDPQAGLRLRNRRLASQRLAPAAIRCVLVRYPSSQRDPQAFLCTALDLEPAAILKRFVSRWRIETTIQEAREHFYGRGLSELHPGGQSRRPQGYAADRRGWPLQLKSDQSMADLSVMSGSILSSRCGEASMPLPVVSSAGECRARSAAISCSRRSSRRCAIAARFAKAASCTTATAACNRLDPLRRAPA
jgi:hypothetical protein